MAPSYKLIYHDLRGLAETARFLLKYGGIEFEDVRVKTEDWPQMKDKTPFGVLPLLEHNGQQAGQSLSINRYLAKQVKLAGNNDWENLEIDSVVDTVNDMKLKLVAVFFEQDEDKQKVLKEKFQKETLDFYLPRLEAVAQKNKGHLALGRLTWADFFCATIFPLFDLVCPADILANYPNLKAVIKNVNELPVIKKWIETRPKTER